MVILNKKNREIFTVTKIDYSKEDSKDFVEIKHDKHGSFVGKIEVLLSGNYKLLEKSDIVDSNLKKDQ